ncbi:MAG: methyl-accepting chemotaxis protein [Candidatus Magnetoglobus multicellularis str. Araruama]|uniref:Methyl-accepting chemotaxis protein n=1 Tax=Candidatus Magnetoglobus multicellularis str. Araruama TaxID=890399 RepID=A0A1V1PBM4_9BACT|nr:MAG: methyl-accepting chemotaxis protein [Candidatus Magnetoglobus multicellularis str. Araruama]
MQKIKDLSLKVKLLVAFMVVGILPLTIGEYLCLSNAEKALNDQALMQLESIRQIKKDDLENFFHERQMDLSVLSRTIHTITTDTHKRLKTIQQLKKNRLESWFHTLETTIHMLKDNPFTAVALYKFNQAFVKDNKRTNLATWQKTEKEYGITFENIKSDSNVYDIFLISPSGDILYTVEKESDLGQNISSLQLKNTGLAQVFRQSKNTAIAISDFAAYPPSDNKPNAFIAGGVYDKGKNYLGVVAIQVPIKIIDSIVQNRSGMGKTGETYLVGKQHGQCLLRSNCLIKKGQLNDPINHEFVKKALNGKKGWTYHLNESNTLEMVLYEPLAIKGLNWGIVSLETIEESIAHKSEGELKDYCQNFIASYDYSDLFLIDSDGFVFYTATKESDYQTNMLHGKYSDSGLGRLIKQVVKTRKFGFADFEPYAPSKGKPSAFIAQPITHNGTVDIVVALQLSLRAINHIMQQRAGMGETGESYLVGPDQLMRSDSFLDPTHHSVDASFRNPSKGKVDTKASRTSLAGECGKEIIMDYNGNPVLSAYCPLSVYDKHWALIVEIDRQEAFAPVYLMQKIIVGIVVVTIVIIILISLFTANSIMVPIQRILQFIDRVRSGDKQIVLKMDSKDEIGQMGNALNEMVSGQRALQYNLDNLPTPVMEIDKNYTVQYMNHAALNFLGLSMKDVVGKKCHSFFKTDHCQTSDCACNRAMASQQSYTADTVADPEGKDVPIRYTGFPVKDENGAISGAIEFVLDVSGERTINSAIVEIIHAINDGDFSKRGDAEIFTGNYRELVMNVNNIVAAFETPLRRIQDYVDRISRGEIPERITDEAKGDFKKLNDNFNQCIDAINNLVKDANDLVDAAIAGRLDTRANVSNHQGDFAKVVKGINDTLDAVLMPINEAQTVLERMSDGDLTSKITGDYHGDHALIKDAINKTLTSLNQILEEVADVSDNVSASAVQLNSASQNLAEGSQEQAASVEEITASVHETDQQIRQNSENTDTANTLVSETNDAASTGQAEMNNLSQAMNAINESAQNISKIIKVIDEIAFQTNILALNAAVEAARAGQHGKGFAVVAQEVRNLAGRSAQAAKETAELIDNSNKKAVDGVQIAERTGVALTHVVENVQKVKNIMGEIAVANKEQTQAMGQINEGMGQINTAVQNISSQSEETASAATQLSAQSDNLKAQLAKFKLLSTENKQRQEAPKRMPRKSLPINTTEQNPQVALPIDTDVRGFGDF